jgi:hypothetical protein
MVNQATATHGVMEGGGSYNLHAKRPAGGDILALPFLEQTVKKVTLESGDQLVVFAAHPEVGWATQYKRLSDLVGLSPGVARQCN